MRVECSHCRKISSISTRAEARDLSRLKVVLTLLVTHHGVEKHYMYDNSACTQVSSFHTGQSAPGTGLESRGMNFVSFIVETRNAAANHFRKRPAQITGTFFASRGCPLSRASTVPSKIEAAKFQLSLIVFLYIRTKTKVFFT